MGSVVKPRWRLVSRGIGDREGRREIGMIDSTIAVRTRRGARRTFLGSSRVYEAS
jgi:hypothetical protein